MRVRASDTLVFIEPGIQARAFASSSVALSFTAGFSLGVIDADGFLVGGQTTGSAGLHYHFNETSRRRLAPERSPGESPRMTKSSLAAVFVLAMLGTAEAGGQEGSLGVGAEAGLRLSNSNLGFASLNYDMGTFHVGGFFAMADGGGDDDTSFGIGGRFYFHLHSTSMADFSVGGSIGLLSLPGTGGTPPTGDDRSSEMFLEPGIQARVFVASNVALSFSAGLTLGLIDADGFAIGGQTTGGAGFHYYFF